MVNNDYSHNLWIIKNFCYFICDNFYNNSIEIHVNNNKYIIKNIKGIYNNNFIDKYGRLIIIDNKKFLVFYLKIDF